MVCVCLSADFCLYKRLQWPVDRLPRVFVIYYPVHCAGVTNYVFHYNLSPAVKIYGRHCRMRSTTCHCIKYTHTDNCLHGQCPAWPLVSSCCCGDTFTCWMTFPAPSQQVPTIYTELHTELHLGIQTDRHRDRQTYRCCRLDMDDVSDAFFRRLILLCPRSSTSRSVTWPRESASTASILLWFLHRDTDTHTHRQAHAHTHTQSDCDKGLMAGLWVSYLPRLLYYLSA